MARKSKKLEEIIKIFDEKEIILECEIEDIKIDSEFIYEIKDKALFITEERDLGYVLHSIESVLLLVIFAMIANCNTFVQINLFSIKHYEWLDKHIKFENGLPSLSTIKRVIGFINPKELEILLSSVMNKFLKNNEPIYKDNDIEILDIKAMDGKTANSSDRNNSKNGKVSKMNAMSVYSVKNDCCEATEFIKDKTNEIPTGPELLKKVNIEKCLVVFDAMSTQTDTIKYIVSKGGFYVAPVKGNQETLENDIKEYFNDEKLFSKAKEENYISVIEKAHGTIEKREYIFINDIDWISNKNKWKDLKSIGVAIRHYENSDGKKCVDRRFFISNIDASKIKIISKSIRDEWAIENKLHLYLDMVFLEDKNKCFLENSQNNLNIIRKFCLALLKKYKQSTKLSMNSIRFNVSMDYEYEIKKIIDTLYT